MVNPGRGVYSVRREHLQCFNTNPWGNVSASGRRRPPASVNVNLERYWYKRFVASFSCTFMMPSFKNTASIFSEISFIQYFHLLVANSMTSSLI